MKFKPYFIFYAGNIAGFEKANQANQFVLCKNVY